MPQLSLSAARSECSRAPPLCLLSAAVYMLHMLAAIAPRLQGPVTSKRPEGDMQGLPDCAVSAHGALPHLPLLSHYWSQTIVL